MMKKQFSAIALLSAAICLTACSGNSGASDNSSSSAPAETTTSTAETTTSAAETTTSAATTTTEAKPLYNEEEMETLRNLEGRWVYEIRDQSSDEDFAGIKEGYITFRTDGTYTYEPLEGSPTNGFITFFTEELIDNQKLSTFTLFHDSGKYFIGCYCVQNDKNIYYTGNGGESRIVRDNGNTEAGTEEGISNSAEEFIGIWNCDRWAAIVEQNGERFHVTINSPSESTGLNRWEYECTYSDNQLNSVSGKNERITNNTDGSETASLINSNAEAHFSIDPNGSLVWDDLTEPRDEALRFSRAVAQ